MHFFHPIQQCAQQIYYTALPLSPTSSSLQNPYLQSIIVDKIPHVTAFIGAPRTWGLLLRTIDTRPRELTCITTSGQGIIAACGDIVNIYDAVTGVLQQSLSPLEYVTKIQASLDGSTLFFAHSSLVTMWDVQTGGLVHTFTTKSGVNDIAVSTSGDHIACGSSDGSVMFWNTRTKKEGKGFGGGQPVMAMCWLPPQKLVVATQNSLYIHTVTTGETLDIISIPDRVWGMVYFWDKNEFLVGTSKPGEDKELCSFTAISNQHPELLKKRLPRVRHRVRAVRPEKQSPKHPGQLVHPTLVGKDIACITSPMGVQSFNTSSYNWTNSPPLLDMAASVAVSLNRNLVVQTKHSIQIFSTDVLMSSEAHNCTRVSHIYPLDNNHIICVLQPTMHITILELETLQELSHNDETLSFRLLLPGSPEPRGLLYLGGEFWTSMAMELWLSGTSLSETTQVPDGGTKPWLTYGLSPAGAKIAAVYDRHRQELWVKDMKDGGVLAMEPLEDDDLGSEEVYDITFSSETRFYLKFDKPGQHVQIPYDITPSPSSKFSHTIDKGEPMPLSEPRATPPYTLDENCEWVLDAQSRKICWISPGNLRRGSGGHFWAGLWLVMVGGDGVLRKMSFSE